MHEELNKLLKNREQLSPQLAADAFARLFRGFDTWGGTPLVQVRWLVEHGYLSEVFGHGTPEFRLASSPSVLGGEWVKHMTMDPITTSGELTADSPHLVPKLLDNAPLAVTVTHAHNTYDARNNHDLLITMNRSRENSKAFWYRKGSSPVLPQPLIDMHQIDSLLPLDPEEGGRGVLIQFWGTPIQDRYYLLATMNVWFIPLTDFISVLALPDNHFRS